jgi:uncharacterized protein YjiS (DUF1127 family)
MKRMLGWVDFMKEVSNQNATRRTLGALSDRELNDIGINRGDINRIAKTKSKEGRNRK